MKTKAKIGICLLISVLFFFVLSLMMVAVFAAKKQSVSSNIVVSYKAEGIEATVSANYFKGNTAGTTMTDDGTPNGNTEINFEMSESETTKTLLPQEEINLKGENNFVVFEYKFFNGSPIDAICADLQFDASLTNFSAFKFEMASEPILDFSLIDREFDNASKFSASTYVGCQQTSYLYIKFKTTSLGSNASLQGDFNFELKVYDEQAVSSVFDLQENEGENSYTLLGLQPGVEITDLNIPNHYCGKKISAIAPNAFAGNTTITSLTIPEDVTAIGDCAFADCTNLTRIDYNAVELTTDLTETSFLFRNAGMNSTGIEAFINAGVKVVPTGLFFSVDTSTLEDDFSNFDQATGYPNITSLTINKRVKNTGITSFAFLLNLTNLTIEEGVEEIGISCFAFCTNLKTLVIPSSINRIGEQAFMFNVGLTRIEYNATQAEPTDQGSGVFASCGVMDEGIDLVFGNKVKQIPDYMFYDISDMAQMPMFATNVKSVYISSSVETIGMCAFAYSSMQQLTFDENCNCLIMEAAFTDCKNLTELTLPKRIIAFFPEAFANCTGLTKLNYNVTQLSSPVLDTTYIFSNIGKDSGGVQVVIGDNVVAIPDYLFYSAIETENTDASGVVLSKEVDCSNVPNITSIKLGKNLRTIGTKAFAYLENLTEVEYAATNLRNLPVTAKIFEGAGALGGGINLNIVEGVQTIPNYLFLSISDLTLENIIETEIANLTSITIPSTVEKIGYGAFANCTHLTNINYAATNCEFPLEYFQLITEEHLPQEFYDIGSHIVLPFANSYNTDGVLKINFEEGVTAIPNFLFCCSIGAIPEIENSTVEITFADSITKIGECSFGYLNIPNLVLPSNLAEIGTGSFTGCVGFTELDLHDNITSISLGAFSSCNDLETLRLGKNIKEIATLAFSELPNLKLLEYDIQNLGPSKFSTNKNGIDYLNSKNAVIFSNSGGETGFKIVFGEGVKVVRAYEFVNFLSDVNISGIQFSSTITTIEMYAFTSMFPNNLITEIVIPASVTSIGAQAFGNFRSLKTVTIESANIYSVLAEMQSGDDYVDPAGELIVYATTIKIAKNIEDGSNTYLNSSAFSKDSSSDPDYVIFTKV